MRDITLAPNASAAIYCVVTDRGGPLRYDLHAVDLTVQPLVGAPITDDDKSGSPRW